MQIVRKAVRPADVARTCRWLLLAFCLYGPLTIWRASQKVDQVAAISRFPGTAEGWITSLSLTGKGGPSFHYAYEVGGKSYSGFAEISVRANFREEPYVGEPVDVTFSVEHPAWSFAGDRQRQPDYGYAVGLGWLFLIVGAIGTVASHFAVARLSKVSLVHGSPTILSRQHGAHLKE